MKFKTFKNPNQIRLELNLLKRNIILYIGKDPQKITFGLTNETQDNYFIPFIDYDDIYFEKVYKDIKHVQAVFGLSDFIIITTEENINEEGKEYGNYHCVCFDKCSYHEIIDILSHTRCDPLYRKRALGRHRSWVLRFEKKYFSHNGKVAKKEPRFKCIIPNKPRIPRECSYAHYLALKKLLNIPEMQLPFDSITECELIQYRTG
jgi:hypothetical protein